MVTPLNTDAKPTLNDEAAIERYRALLASVANLAIEHDDEPVLLSVMTAAVWALCEQSNNPPRTREKFITALRNLHKSRADFYAAMAAFKEESAS